MAKKKAAIKLLSIFYAVGKSFHPLALMHYNLSVK